MGNKNDKIKEGAKLVGNKFTRGSIDELRDAGYKKADIQAIADRIGNVGDKVQNKISGWSDSRGGGQDDKKPWISRSVQLPGTSGYRLWTNEDGGVAARNKDVEGALNGVQFGGLDAYKNRMATARSADKLNKYLEKTGYSLEGGKGQTVVGYRPITLERTSFGGVPYMNSYQGGLDGELPGGVEYVAIYSGKAPKKDGGKKDNGGEEGGGEEGFPGPPAPGSLSPGGSRGGRGSGDGSVRSTVDVPEVQDWGIEEQIAEQEAAERARIAAETAAFQNVLQATSNTNYSPIQTYSPTNAVNPNPSAWENVLADWNV